jgi:CYTH domain-containing protein
VFVEVEFASFHTSKNTNTEKTRYCYTYQDLYAELDVFDGKLQGLVVVDFEFETEEDKNAFSMPDFCLADVTQELFIAGGMLAGKGYADIEEDLQRFGYKKLFLQY